MHLGTRLAFYVGDMENRCPALEVELVRYCRAGGVGKGIPQAGDESISTCLNGRFAECLVYRTAARSSEQTDGLGCDATPVARCPLLEETEVGFCTAFPIRKEIPIGVSSDAGPCLVFADDLGVGDRLAELLRARGGDVVCVRAGDTCNLSGDDRTINPGSRADYVALLAELRSANRLPESIIHLWGVTGNHDAGAAADRSPDLGFYSLLYIAQALGEIGSRPEGHFQGA